MAEHPQNRDAQAQATSASQIRPNENTSERTAWRPLRLPMFRNLLIADLVSDIGTFMQGVGAAWLLVAQGAGPLLVALTQTASALPFFLLALPAGALGDIFDRRKLILATEAWMLCIATALAVLTLLHSITPWLLLLLTLALAIGDALEAPTWRAVLPEVVPQEDLLPALALNGIEFNLARAIGPALGGFLIAVAGVATAFTLNALSFLAVLWVIARWKRPARQSGLPRETLSGATRAAIRYTRNAPEMLTVLGRIASIMFFASAFWALLPTVAHALGSSSTLYGLLLTEFGGGAVVAISGGHAGHRNYVVCGCAVGNDNVQVRRAAVRRHCVGRSSLDGGDVPDERGNAERCAGLGPRKGAGCFSAGVYGLVGCRERVLGICRRAPRHPVFLGGGSHRHSGVSSADSDFAVARCDGRPRDLGPLAKAETGGSNRTQ